MNPEDAIDAVEAVRRDNNALWMKLLRLALSAAPSEAKAILRQINANDRKISTLLAELAG